MYCNLPICRRKQSICHPNPVIFWIVFWVVFWVVVVGIKTKDKKKIIPANYLFNMITI